MNEWKKKFVSAVNRPTSPPEFRKRETKVDTSGNYIFLVHYTECLLRGIGDEAYAMRDKY